MKEQNFSNHIRYYPPHHFVFYPVILISTILCISRALSRTEHKEEWIALSALFIVVGWLAFMLRQHYALTNQNRIVRLEVRVRYFELTGKRFSEIASKLSFGQIAALRFASDEEFVALIRKTINENLSPKEIKKSISHWNPDYMRV